MRDIVSCFAEDAVNVSHSSCSGYANNACIPSNSRPSVRNSVSCVYQITLSTQKRLLITVTWCKNNSDQRLSVNFDDDSKTAVFKLNTNLGLFRKKKGSKMVESAESKIEFLWDLSHAKYEAGPEPVNGFYVVIFVDSQIGLILGDMAEEAVTKKFKSNACLAKVSLISRQEHCSGNTLYSTKAQFCETGNWHEILIRYSTENDRLKNPVLTVCIDKKTVIRVQRLQWNFRGNQTIFLDDLLVDLLWDVHDWFFNPASGCAVFMFRTRSGLDSRLWLEEKATQKEKDRVEFSLLIYASKST